MQATHYFDDTAIPVMRCPGRVRIKFPRLYRSPYEKNKIEAALGKHRDILAVHASPLTENVFIIFDEAIPADLFIKKLGMTEPDEHNKTTTPAKGVKPDGSVGKRQTNQHAKRAEHHAMYPS
ncbi:MAG TPA: hypothetical protein VIF82_00775 [Burkholderiaceae bacterium]